MSRPSQGLWLATGLSLPLDAVTETLAILAMRGAGKSTTAAVMAEQMARQRIPFVVIDPDGSWWGLRASADGDGPGLPIPIFGGRHGDVPLEKTGGALIADLIVSERLSSVLDLSAFESEGGKKQFLLDFARRLYVKNEAPLHLFLEEADDYIPQKPMRDEAQLLRAWENIVRRGRKRGLGLTLITQRSAVLNKNVLTQVGTLIVMRTTSPQDQAAIEAWIKYHRQAPELLESLGGLADGEAWVWSPYWLKTMRRVQIHRRTTFDSAATPTLTKDRRPAATLADVDLAAVTAKMAATIERAKAEDPRELRRRISELERTLEHAATPTTAARPIRTIAVLKDGQLARLERVWSKLTAEATRHRQAMGALWEKYEQALGPVLRVLQTIHRPELASAAPAVLRPVSNTIWPHPLVGRPATSIGESEIGQGGLRRILRALAQCSAGLSSRQIGVRAGLSSRSGTFGTYLGHARRRGWIAGGRDRLTITADGLSALGAFEPLPTGPALLAYWLQELGQSGAARLLRVLAEAFPEALSKEEAAARAGLSASSGTFGTYLGKLRALELVHGSSELRASEELR
jgi:uncharacterized protein